MTQKQHFTLRLSSDTLNELVRRAQRSGKPKTVLAEQLIEEGLRMAKHPGIVFRDGAAGRRPGLAANGLDIWEVIETVLLEHGDIQATADYFCIPAHLISTAVGYYADYKQEIDDWIEEHHRISDEAESAWRRQQAVVQPA